LQNNLEKRNKFQKRLFLVDVFRSLAIILVILFHAGLFSSGYIGVDLFFFISGFLNYKKFASLELDNLFPYFFCED